MKENTRINRDFYILFIVYLLSLIWIILFKFSIPGIGFQRLPVFSINLIPFSELATSGIVRGDFICNILIFIPFGIFLARLYKSLSLARKIAIISTSSLVFEILQYVFSLGAGDINDLISNSLGGIIGIQIYILLTKFLSSEEKTDTFLLWGMIILGAIAFIGLGIIFFY